MELAKHQENSIGLNDFRLKSIKEGVGYIPISLFANDLGPITRKHTTFTTQDPNLKQSVKGGYTQ